MRRIFAYLVVLGVCLGGWQPAIAQNLFAIGFTGPNGPASFFTVNRATGAATIIGAVGFERCGSMDVSPMGTVVAVCERSGGSNIPVLITIDPATGVGTEVGPLGLPVASDISFQPGSGVLFANRIGSTLFTINTTTGVATDIGATGLPNGSGQALGFDQAGTLFESESPFPLAPLGPPTSTRLIQQLGSAPFCKPLSFHRLAMLAVLASMPWTLIQSLDCFLVS